MVPTNNLERQIEMMWNYEPISELEVEALCAKVRRKGMYRRSTHMLPSTEIYTENNTDLKELPEMGGESGDVPETNYLFIRDFFDTTGNTWFCE
ncbi:hypothetical protein RvY_11334 [Ramazzottius varieornatus]|uniref:Uncharacterized protein n=1 Tax=Ramazzottius varieornatus TaxID=947166 RepID=A0A1D1VFT4_RAMVA|nr:hypothetical protein RvY_11334 [Ramazzottius varieornatus]